MKFPEDSKRMKAVLTYLGLTDYKLAKKLNYQSAGSINQITRGIVPLNDVRAKRINDVFPQISFQYLIGVDTEMIASDEMQQITMNAQLARKPKPPNFDKKFFELCNNMAAMQKDMRKLVTILGG